MNSGSCGVFTKNPIHLSFPIFPPGHTNSSHNHGGTMAPSQRICLLSLPTEIRCLIYEGILRLNMNCNLFQYWCEAPYWRHGGHFQRIVRRPYVKFSIPWTNMRLACKTIYYELTDFMRTGSALNNLETNTWKLDMPLLRFPTMFSWTRDYHFAEMTWQRLPCTPHNVHSLHLTTRIPKERQTGRPSLWCEKYTAHRLQFELYQTINHVLHCGPLMRVGSRLAEPIHVETVRIEVGFEADDFPLEANDTDYWSEEDREESVDDLYDQIAQWCSLGVGYGLIDKFEIVSPFGTSTLPVSKYQFAKPVHWSAPQGRDPRWSWGMSVVTDRKARDL
ncbi:hypothetical protein CKM354_000216100 [Cercospora kikuchii]|uniref:Uncharacterized protein n=1 Tax=Cercospora kikuchii TaxID=84275 RepID=A0A9P3C8R5_9PEZI|nr:uncharacterized protein CKM354_000216100 [Cercospora kikuchii]GIZ38757.1 hypothetical protein CKM354_000216100 [Cercospora kikuchii]